MPTSVRNIRINEQHVYIENCIHSVQPAITGCTNCSDTALHPSSICLIKTPVVNHTHAHLFIVNQRLPCTFIRRCSNQQERATLCTLEASRLQLLQLIVFSTISLAIAHTARHVLLPRDAFA